VIESSQVSQNAMKKAKATYDLVVLIPVHDPKIQYKSFLEQAILSIMTQTIRPKSVLLVANHDLPYIKHLEARAADLKIRFHLSGAASAAENINFGVARSEGHFTKILFQDDLLSHDEALEESVTALSTSGKKWSVIGSRDWDETTDEFFKPMAPRFTEKLDRGINTIGAPSVVTFETEYFVPFDNRLHYMFDCDWYLSMAHNFGKPVEIKNVGVTIRRHSGQATIWAKSLLKKEKTVVRAKHRRVKFFTRRHLGNCACTQDKQ
jgi:hypothetical protein